MGPRCHMGRSAWELWELLLLLIKGDKANKWEQGYGYGLAGQSHVTNLAI